MQAAILFYFLQALNDKLVLLKLTASIVFLIFQLFMFCLLGTQLSDAAASVGIEAYNFPFHRIKRNSIKKTLALIMCRSQKKVVITAGNRYHINLKTFLEAIHLIYSYFFVVKTLLLDKIQKIEF